MENDDLQTEKAAVQHRIDFCFRHMTSREEAMLATEGARLYARLVKLIQRSQLLIARPSRYVILMRD